MVRLENHCCMELSPSLCKGFQGVHAPLSPVCRLKEAFLHSMLKFFFLKTWKVVDEMRATNLTNGTLSDQVGRVRCRNVRHWCEYL